MLERSDGARSLATGGSVLNAARSAPAAFTFSKRSDPSSSMRRVISSIQMLNAQPAEARKEDVSEGANKVDAGASIAVVLLTIPLLTGPATISTVVIYSQRTRLPADVEQQFQANYCTLEELLRSSDFISLHLPRSPATVNFIDTEIFGPFLMV